MGAVLAVAALIVFAALTATPAPPNETIVVLPAPDGHVGGVVVQRGDSRQLLDKPYAGIRSGETRVTQLPAAEVRQRFGAILSALPPRPASFVLHFVTGTDELTDESKAELPKVLSALRERPVPDVLVVGHTDTMGEPAANDRLSAQRAERVKSHLVEIGIRADRIRTAGRGERELLIATPDDVDEPRNRRVEIIVR
jgi:outer membrane protein OmpA-like peptidoglycan-associated protein